MGAGIVVVRGDEILAARGYGLADREAGRPVVPGSTLFPAQSVSKLFAATAVMQLAERGLVDLDADVRTWVDDVAMDSGFPEPVTLAQLLTHTAGFDDSYIGLLPRTPGDVLTVPEFLNDRRPKVVYRPGTVHAYSNYGSLLARHVVEKVTGRDYEDYLREEILRPLGMSESCPLPPPPEWADRVATGYLPGRGGLESTRDEFPDGLIRFRTPTGTVISTVVDMARFVTAQLGDGSVDGGRVLEPDTVRLMHRRHFSQGSAAPGVAYGFFESLAGGRRGLFHFGSGFGYGTLLYLLPEEGVGFYLAHSNSASRIDEAFLNGFLRRYFPTRRPAVAPSPATFETRAEGFAGFWAPVRRPQSTFETLPFLLLQARLRAPDERTLANDQLLPREWVRTGPLTFERPEGGGGLAFQENAAGRPALLSIWDDEEPELLVLERMPWFDSTPALLARLGWFALVFFLGALAWPLGALWRRRRRRRGVPLRARLVTPAAGAAATLDLAFLVGLAWVFVSRDWMFGVSPVLVAILCLPLAAIACVAIAVLGALRTHGELAGRPLARGARILMLATLVLFPLFLWRWHLLGFVF